MTEPEKTYTATFRHNARQPQDWQETLSRIPGLTLISTTGRHARIKGTPEAISQLGDDVIVEEELPRYL